jgi:hypothetical protein
MGESVSRTEQDTRPAMPRPTRHGLCVVIIGARGTKIPVDYALSIESLFSKVITSAIPNWPLEADDYLNFCALLLTRLQILNRDGFSASVPIKSKQAGFGDRVAFKMTGSGSFE